MQNMRALSQCGPFALDVRPPVVRRENGGWGASRSVSLVPFVPAAKRCRRLPGAQTVENSEATAYYTVVVVKKHVLEKHILYHSI